MSLRSAVCLSAALALSLLAPAPVVLAQTEVKVELGAGGPASRNLSLPRGKSAIVELPVDARDVLVSNPEVADAVLRTPRRIYVLGVGAGQTDAVFFDGAGRQILSLNIRVDQPTGALVETIRRVAPDAQVQVEAIGDSVVLTGSVANIGDADRIQRVAERFVGKPEQVLNMVSVRGADQVTVRVRVVEMQRNLVKQFGVNVNAVLNQVGEPQYFLGNVAQFAVNGGIQGGLSGGYDLNTTKQPVVRRFDPATQQWFEVVDRNDPIAAPKDTAGDSGLNQARGTLQAFERVGLVRTLAEPNLTAVSGESARFLAGGEFPVPSGRDQSGNVVIEFKPFGVGLGVTPVVLSDGRISLKISTEVSELSNQGAFTLGDGATRLVIPGLTVRRAETTVELPSGGAFMIAGLLQESTRQNIDAIPGMTTMPVLGALFRSRDYQSGETELVIIVEPYLVRPTDPRRMQTPVDGLQIASDAQTVLLGRLNRVYRPAAPAPTRPYQGPVGYVIE